ncbi:MAG: hypothetical protein ACRD0Q_12250 [Acidimicrobiales bacterium]
MLTTTGGPRSRLTWREDMVTVAVAAWLIFGLFVDGWAHNNSKPESFFTPWHGLFYSGFAACAFWICAKSLKRGMSPRDGAPVGYGLGLVGVAVFAVGGMVLMVPPAMPVDFSPPEPPDTEPQLQAVNVA